MLEKNFTDVYTKFKLQFYKKIFNRFETREATLSAVETFSVEAIYALDSPTVNEFATFTQISPQNAAYKVNSLIKKGYVKKIQSKNDKREYHLEVTEKFLKYYGLSYDYIMLVMNRIRERFSNEDIERLEKILEVMSKELMPEVEREFNN